VVKPADEIRIFRQTMKCKTSIAILLSLGIKHFMHDVICKGPRVLRENRAGVENRQQKLTLDTAKEYSMFHNLRIDEDLRFNWLRNRFLSAVIDEECANCQQ